MTRRALLAVLTGAVINRERLLWTPKRYVQGMTLHNPTRVPFDPSNVPFNFRERELWALREMSRIMDRWKYEPLILQVRCPK